MHIVRTEKRIPYYYYYDTDISSHHKKIRETFMTEVVLLATSADYTISLAQCSLQVYAEEDHCSRIQTAPKGPFKR